MNEIYAEILKLEKKIHEIQIDHSLNKISTKAAKQKIRELTEELQKALMQLPDVDRELYLLEKQHGIGS